MMQQGAEFLEYLRLQDTLDMITKSELLDYVRRHGARISDRQLTTFISEGLIPESARIGSRSGAYPQIVRDLLLWVVAARKLGLSMKAIKELLPLWRFFAEACRKHELSLAELEYLARQHVTLQEAAAAIPSLFLTTMACPICHRDDLRRTTVVKKDGVRLALADGEAVTLDFFMLDQDEESGIVRAISHLPIPLSRPPADPMCRIVLGVPNGIDIPEAVFSGDQPVSIGAPSAGPENEEV